MRYKRLIRGSLAILLSTSVLVGCFPKEEEKQTDFNAYIESLPSQMMSNTDMNLEFLFENPANYGFEEELLTLPFSDEEDYKQSEVDNKAMLDELATFDYNHLTEDQKMTYDILKDSLERSSGLDKFYYLDNSYLGSFVGFQAQLPLLLNEYTFERENDLNSYFNILETSEETFLQYAKMERERVENGVGMSKAIMDKVIEQCNNFSKDEDTFLIAAINEKIDAVSFLNDEQKAEAKAKNEKLLKENFVKAYKSLGDELAKIDVDEEDKGLAQLPNGKEYYEYLLKKKTGIDDSVEDVKKYFEKHMTESMLQFQVIQATNPEAAKTMDLGNLKYTNHTNFEDTIDYLGEQMVKDYPEVGKLNYDITIVPEAMKDNFSPAAYLQGKIDAPADAPEHIWINSEFNQDIFSTLAHEGYPGHMYQNTYFRQLKLPVIRYLIDYNGYSEGWATYIEGNSWQYADVSDEEKIHLQLAQLNQEAVHSIIALMDIGIHYEGWSYETYLEQISQYFDSSEESLKEQYYYILETPTNYLQYYLNGAKYQDLMVDAKEELGAKFDPIKFNEAILKTGPAPMKITEKEVQKYIDSYSAKSK